MSVIELMPALRELSRAEKLRVVEFLVRELSEEEAGNKLALHGEHSVWSPYDADSAARTLLALLDEDQSCDRG